MAEQRTAGGVEYELTRKRVKNLNLRVRPNGTVAASAPLRMPQAQVDAFVAGRAGWVQKAKQAMAAREAAQSRPTPTKQECLTLFEPVSERVFPYFKEVLGGQRPTLAVRNMRTRWGSCHVQKKKITLASTLALASPAAIEYVVVHEYCHFVHPNHQKDFWALVGRLLPDYKARRALLKALPGDNADKG